MGIMTKGRMEMSRSWYVSAELHREITTWQELTICFTHTFSFTDAIPDFHNSLHLILNAMLKVVLVAYPMDQYAHCQMQSMIDCYNVIGGPNDGDDPRSANILESEGSQNIMTPYMLKNKVHQPLKIQKVNIGTEE